ncbi:MAG: phosphatase PAP2 family protein [Chloroflexi bacterium]|nr:phosphatase PAP2 family protein [Chloroflexota bacterium]MDA1174144.1 phosphatase PAP2 family protein [Chloroflexota bacterium]
MGHTLSRRRLCRSRHLAHHATGWLLKLFVDRPRPPAEALIRITSDFSGLGFPSGHAFQSTLVIGLLIGVAALRMRPGRLRLATIGLLALLIVAIGFSRIYLGAHWPSDVLGGYLAATPIVLVTHARLSSAVGPIPAPPVS